MHSLRSRENRGHIGLSDDSFTTIFRYCFSVVIDTIRSKVKKRGTITVQKKLFSQTVAKIIAVSMMAFGILVPAVGAQTTSSTSNQAGNGIRISPVRTDLVINPGETRQLSVSIANMTSATAEYQVLVNDFIAGNNEFGQPALILDADKFAPSHSLKRYIKAIANITVPAGQSKEVKVSITVPKDAAAGGYYGAVRFAPASNSDAGKNLTLSASVGSLILVKVPGDIKENLTLDSFDVRKGTKATSGSSFFTSNKDLYAVARFKNTGNVHEQPFGKVTVKHNGKLIETVEINNTDPRGNALPDSIRRFDAKLSKVGSWGKYEVSGNFGYGANGQLLSASTSFYVVPLALILLVALLLLALAFLIFGLPKMVKNYNRRVIQKASRR